MTPADPQSAEPMAVLPPDIREEVTQTIRVWARTKFGKWITWQTAWGAAREICGPVAKALLAERQAREAAEREATQWQQASGQSLVRAERLEDDLEANERKLAKAEARIAEQDRANAHLQDNNSRMAEGWTKMQARIAELEAAFLDIAHFTPDAATGVDQFEQIARHARATTLAVLSSINKEPSHG